MNRLTLSICGKRESNGWKISRYAYQDEVHDGERVKDANFVRQLAERLAPAMGNDSTWNSQVKPSADEKVFFEIYVDVQNHGKSDARYAIDYRNFPGTPLEVVTDGMEIYQAIRKYGIRPAMKQVEANRHCPEDKKVEITARQEVEDVAIEKPKVFELGENYAAEYIDDFGHIQQRYIKYDERWRRFVRKYDNGNEYISHKGLIYKAESHV